MNETFLQMIYLISCALHNTAPDEKYFASIDGNALYSLAKRHRLRFIVESALEKTVAFDSFGDELKKKWTDVRAEVLRKNLILDYERNSIFEEFEKSGIKYVPLKGCVVQTMYPEFGMREYSDNDILIDSSANLRSKVKDIMEERGYTVSEYLGPKHDVYCKPPCLDFEMHVLLFEKDQEPVSYEYYKDVWNRLIPNEDGKYGYHFSSEDLYVYCMAHTGRHSLCTGDGIRTLIDSYVMRNMSGNSLNLDYIGEECEKLGIGQYESQCRILADKLFTEAVYPDVSLFSDEETTGLEKKSVSVFGQYSNYVDVRMEKYRNSDGKITFFGRFRYALSRLFPGPKYFRAKCPNAGRFPFLLPFYWVYRIFHEYRIHGKLIQTELKQIKSHR